MNKINKTEELHLDYSDVFIFPQYSEVTSRKNIKTDISICYGLLKMDVPIISANMDTVSESEMCIAMAKAGGIGALHRFLTIDKNVEEYVKVKDAGYDCFVSIGVNEESKNRAVALKDAGAKLFVIDIAHGNSLMMKNMLLWLRETVGHKAIIMAGNVATADGVKNLESWGADIAKVGIGPGAVCLTKNVTGVTRPQFSAVLECSQANSIPIVADGGITEIGDICKAIGAGAYMVMAGKMFASCKEAAGLIIDGNKKQYRGMASRDAMSTIKREEDMSTPEGKTEFIKFDSNKSAINVVKDIKGGLQSAMSYTNSNNILEFHKNATFGIRKTLK